ncbi:hypothetical protein LLS1_17230 [Leifsonia sp. LS1]|nr:hypothetical protein LLS1_17230 [Leifsonia sp. LS1]
MRQSLMAMVAAFLSGSADGSSLRGYAVTFRPQSKMKRIPGRARYRRKPTLPARQKDPPSE